MSDSRDPRRDAALAAFGLRAEWMAREAAPQTPQASPAAHALDLATAPGQGDAGAAASGAAVDALDWDALEATVAACTRCGLCRTRTQTVFGVGDRHARWMFIGEAPGENEDLQGEPFVGQAGRLLDNMLRAIGLERGRDVYIANVLKCRPPRNRDPEPDEIANCEPYLLRQIALVKPTMIVVLGRFAAHTVLRTDVPVGRLRGKLHRYADVPLVVTYHPAYLLRTPGDKAKVWDDLCLARAHAAELGTGVAAT